MNSQPEINKKIKSKINVTRIPLVVNIPLAESASIPNIKIQTSKSVFIPDIGAQTSKAASKSLIPVRTSKFTAVSIQSISSSTLPKFQASKQ